MDKYFRPRIKFLLGRMPTLLGLCNFTFLSVCCWFHAQEVFCCCQLMTTAHPTSSKTHTAAKICELTQFSPSILNPPYYQKSCQHQSNTTKSPNGHVFPRVILPCSGNIRLCSFLFPKKRRFSRPSPQNETMFCSDFNWFLSNPLNMPSGELVFKK